jgi:hypothetical protein
MRPTLVFVLGILAGAGGAFALVGRARPPVSAAEQADAPPLAARALQATSSQAVPDLRPALRARVAAVLAENRRGHELDVYLDELERAARAQGHVSALEVAPGLAAIEAAYPEDTERSAAFARRMEDLQRELVPNPPPPADEPPAGVTAASVLQALSTTPSGPERDKLVRQALVAIGRLPEAEQFEASQALERATSTAAPAEAPAAPETLLAQISATTDPAARRTLVERFSAAAGSLPPDQQAPLYRQLDEATAARP